ncbi:Protein SOK1 [Leucoagaricus sp. SymC.cos]|nr:Protein SOK1 [Leucoagaricus sp. SymC.cos]
MDDLAHELPLNHRKRKARQDDRPDDKTESPTKNRDSDVAARPAKAPRLSWLSPNTSSALWNSPTSPQVSTPLTSPSALSSAFPLKSSQGVRGSFLHEQPSSPSSPTTLALSDPVSDRTDSEGEDMSTDPVLCQSPQLDVVDVASSIPATTLDVAALHIPPNVPLINRQTLKDLDFNEIMHNRQLRHDILFDSGLLFRPAGHRRKKEYIERYWDAVTREVENGCSCVSYDASSRKYIPTVCVCKLLPPPTDVPVTHYFPPSHITIRSPLRVRALLDEFLEVLLHVIQPLSMLSGPYVNPDVLQVPIQEHTEQAMHIRSLFDPDLIEQELKHGIFDPSGLFQVIGATLKAHCAPMRDHAVDSMVEAAKACAPDSNGSKRDAVKVIRNCLEILELMKLDIANHQMQTLRPLLVYSSGSFERKMLSKRRSINPTLPITKEWLRHAHSSITSQAEPIKLPSHPQGLRYASLSQKQQLYISVVRGIVDTVFCPPSSSSPATLSTNLRPSPIDSSFPSFPETLYLDQGRIQNHTSEITDTVALWMFLLLFRQLTPCLRRGKYQKDSVDEYAAILKRDIRAIGPRSLGACFLKDADTSSDMSALGGSNQLQVTDKLRSAMDDVVLQVAHCQGVALPRSPPSLFEMKKPAQKPSWTNGLEMLADEVQSLVDKISLLVVVHFNAYLPLYEKEDFLRAVL